MVKEMIDPGLFNDLGKFGVEVGNWSECFHCGNCTASCPLTETESLFPRKEIRLLQIGLKKELAACAEPWLCYYCGDCSKQCPREANPGELMMALRRYLTTVYDWTGLARRIYTSKAFELGLIGFIALVVMGLFITFTTFPSGDTAQYIRSTDGGVLINNFASWHKIHFGDFLMAGSLAFILVTNVFNMWWKIILSDKSVKVPFKAYFTEILALPTHFLTQRRFKKCDESTRSYWYIHLFLMLSYIMLFTMIVFFLEWFQADVIHPIWHPQRLLGYISTIGLFTGIIFFIIRRLKKASESTKYSHYTDWTFLVMLFLTTLTGILLHFFRIWGMPVAVWVTYLIHLMVLVPMLIIEVPFSKWSHLAYRPMAIYLAKVKQKGVKV
jgi:quinone-modifying oxidoreductase, subunit QmoC